MTFLYHKMPWILFDRDHICPSVYYRSKDVAVEWDGRPFVLNRLFGSDDGVRR